MENEDGRGINYRALDDLFAVRDSRLEEVSSKCRSGSSRWRKMWPPHRAGMTRYRLPVASLCSRAAALALGFMACIDASSSLG